MTTLESSTTDNEQNKKKPKIKYPEIEELFEAWRGAPSGMPFMSKDLIPASIEVHDKKITAVPRWDDSSTGEEVMNWWIK